MTELANAYVQLTVSTRGMQRDVESALKGIESSGDKTGKSLGQKISTGIGSTLKKGAVATGVAAGAALGTALTKGIGRLNAIEQAESKLTGLGHSASTVQGAMDSALKAVKGTAFGLDEAATTASMVMAAGIKPGKELEQVLTTVGDTAAIAGTSMSEMGDIFGKVAAKGKLQGDDLNRLTERGIPALQLLSEELGVTTAEAQKMASDGEISFEIFERAMRRGVGGAAQEMGNTTQGAFKNMMAAMGRFGATLAGPFFTQAGAVFRGLTDMFDNLDTRAGPVMERLGRWMTSTAVPALQKFGRSAKAAFEEFKNSSLVTSSLARLEGVFTTLGTVGVGVGSALKDIGSALLEAGKALGVSAWQIFLSTLEAGSAVLSALVGPLQAVSGFMKDHPALVTAAVAAWAAFKTVPTILASIGTPLKGVVGQLKNFATVGRSSGEAAKNLATAQETLTTAQATSAAASAKVIAAEQSLQRLRLQAVTGTQRVQAAEAQLNTLRSSGIATKAQITAAERQLDAARKSSDATAKKIVAAEASVGSARNAAAGAASRAAAAETALAKAQTSASLSGRFRATTGSIREYQAVLMQANPAMSAAGAHIRSLATAAGTAASAGFAKMRASASNLLSLIGGPWGAAFAGAAIAVTSVIAGNQKLEAAQDQLKSSSSDLARAQQDMWRSMGDAAKVSDAIADQVDAMMSSIEASINSAQRGITGGWNAFWEDLKTGNLFSGDSPGLQMKEQANMMADAAERARVSFQELGMSNRDVATSVQGTSGDYELLIAKLRGTADGGRDAIAQLAPLREEFLQQQGLSARVGEGYLSLQSSLGTLANEASSSDDKLNALRNTLELLGIISPSASQQIQDMAASVKQLGDAYGDVAAQGEGFSQSVDEFGNKFLLDSGELNLANANTHALADAYRAVADEVNTMVINGASYEEIMSAMGPQFDALGAKAADAGLDVGTLNDQFGLADRDIQASISVQGLEPAERDLVAVTDKMKDVENGATATVRLEGGEASVAELRRLGVEIVSYDEKTGEAKIRVNDDDVRVKLNDANGKLLEFGGKSVSPKVDADKVPFDTKIQGAGGQLLGLTDQSANPTIGANKTPFDTSIWGANTQLFGFDQSAGSATLSAEDQAFFGSLNAAQLGVWGFGSMYSAATLGANASQAHANTGFARNDINSISSLFPIATLDANGQPAHTNTSSARTDIESINNAKGTGKLDADNGSVKPNVDTAQGWINGLLGRTVTVTFKAVYEGFRDMVGLGNFRGGAWNGARALPGFASGGHSGYRLPTTGPGTNVTDGFVAFDSNNVPAARLDAGEWIINRRNSEKYNKELAQINAGTFPKLPGYADGGKHGIRSPKQMLDFVWNRTSDGQSRALDGAPYDWAGINWGDCSAAMAAIARFAVGLAPFGGRFATANQRESLQGMGFTIGRGQPGDLRFGWWNGGPGGGHTFGTLPDGTNVEMRGGGRGGIIGKDAWPWNHPQATDHAFLPMPSFKFAGASGLDAFKPPTIDGAAETSTATGGMGAYAASQAGYSGGGKDNTPKTWSDVAGQSAYNMVSGLTEDVLGVFGVPNDLPPLLQAYNMMQDAEEHGGVSTWDVSQAAAKLKQYEAEIELRKRVVAEGKKAVDLMRDSKVGDPGIGVLSAAENKLEDEVKLLRNAAENADLAKARLDELLETREAAAAAKQAGSGVSGMSASELGQEAGGLGEFPSTEFPDNIDREIVIKYDPAGGAEQWRPMVIAAMKRQGMHAWANDPAIVDKFIRQIDSESKGDPNIAQQIVDVNGTGDAAGVGLGQIIPTTFAASRDPELPDDRRNPWSNLNAMVRYVRDNNKLNVIGNGHGYWKGGQIPFGSGKRDDVPLVAAEGEYIVNRFAAARNRGLLEDINSGRTSSESRGGDTFNVYAFDLESSLRELDKRQKQRALANFGVRG